MTDKFALIEGHKLRRKVRAIISDEQGRFLLIQPYGYAQDNWTLVGGGVEAGESDWQAILREIAEETGIVALKTIEMSATQHWFRFSDQFKTQRGLDYDGQVAKLFFVTVAAETKVQIQAEEIQAYCWASFDDALMLIKVEAQRQLFIEVLNEFSVYSDIKNHPIERTT